MSNEQTIVEPEVVEEKEQSSEESKVQESSEEPKVEEQEEPMQIEVDGSTAFQMKMLEFDKNIATAEAQAANLKQQKMEFVYQHNVEIITSQHKENLIKQQVEQETKKKLAEK